MGLFDFVENFFFISLGITFALILLLVYHFKQRISSMERKGDTMFELLTNVVKEMQCIKGINKYYESFFESSPKDPTCATNNCTIPLSYSQGGCPFPHSSQVDLSEKRIIDLSLDDSLPIVSNLNVVKQTVSKIVVSDDESDSDEDSDDSDSDCESDASSEYSECSEVDIEYNEVVYNEVPYNEVPYNEGEVLDNDVLDNDVLANHEVLVDDVLANHEVLVDSVLDNNILANHEVLTDDVLANHEVLTDDVLANHEVLTDDVLANDVLVNEVLVESVLVDDVLVNDVLVNDMPSHTQKHEVYLKMNITQLKTLAISVGIEQDISKMKKKELIRLLESLDE